MWREEHSTFQDYVRIHWHMHESRAYEFLKAAEIMKSVAGCKIQPENASQLRPFAAVAPADRAADGYLIPSR